MTRFNEVVEDMICGLDKLLDILGERHALEEQRQHVKDWREVGLGLMGMADLALTMGLGYGTPQFIRVLDTIMHSMINTAVQASARLASEKGTFPKYDYRLISESKFFKEVLTEETQELVRGFGLRNSRLLSIAPTGSISNIIGVSGGVEPYFMLGYQRIIKSIFEEEKAIWVYEKTPLLMMRHFKIDHHDYLPEWAKITSQNIPFENRAQVQATIQKYVDTAISSTFNIPNDANTDAVVDIYMRGWELGFKGATVFRDNCKKIGILSNGGPNFDKNPAPKPEVAIEELWYDKYTGDLKSVSVKLKIEDSNYKVERVEREICPVCASPLVKQSGCTKCSNNECVYEKCAL